MSDPPGKVLSSLTPCSDKRTSKLGGCAGVFFQLFDWNRRLHGKRLFPHKLLPAERPCKQASRNHKDEKLPMAKLLLIADENRGGFPRASQYEAGEAFIKEKTPEKKKKTASKRSPSVVAKLMGLETMPSPRKERRRFGDNPIDNFEGNSLCADQKAPSFKAKSTPDDRKSSSTMDVDANLKHGKHTSTSQHSSSMYSDENSHMQHPMALIRHKSDNPKPMFFCKLPALSPRKADCPFRSILSPSKSHNKLVSPIKSPLATKSAARLFEAAVKILEPSRQPSIRGRNPGISSNAARPLLGDGNNEEEKAGNKVSRAPLCSRKKPSLALDSKKQQQGVSSRFYPDQSKAQIKSKQEKKPGNAMDSNAISKSQQVVKNNRRGSSVSSHQEALKRSGSAREEAVPHMTHSVPQQRLIRSKSVKDEGDCAKSSNGHDHDVRAGKEDKVKAELRKQQQTCSKLRQSAAGVKKRGSGTKQEADPSLLKGSLIQSESQASNITKVPAINGEACKSLSADSIVTTASSSSSSSGGGGGGGNSGILNYGRLFSSRKSVTCHEHSKRTEKKGDSSLMKSLLRKRAGTTDSVAKSGSKPMSEDCQTSKHGNVSALAKQSALISQDENSSDPLSMLGECITEESLANIDSSSSCGIESSSCASPSLEYTSDVVKNRDVSADTGTESTTKDTANWEASDSTEIVSSLSARETYMMHSDVSAIEHSIQSSCEFSMGDVSDTASSYAYPELGNHRRKKPVSYSGKTTAAILQELLMALNSSKTQLTVEEKLQNMSNSSDCLSSSEVTGCAQLEPVGTSCSGNSGYGQNQDHDNSANSVDDETSMISRSMKRFASRGECTDEWRHPSPISTLEPPFEDESSTFSDSFESTQESRFRGVTDGNHPDFVSRRHNIDILFMDLDSNAYKEAYECEEKYVKDIVGTAKLSPVNIYAARLQLPCALIDSVVFENLEEQFHQQWEWGIMPEDNMDGMCRSEIDMRFTKSHYEEAAVQNRKLIFDCINEALSLHFGISEQQSQQCFPQILNSSGTHLSRSVYRQMNAWRGMACSMNIDDMVDKEMNAGTGKWVDFSNEVSELAVEMEGSIVGELIDELVAELIKRLPVRKGTRKECIWAGPRTSKRCVT